MPMPLLWPALRSELCDDTSDTLPCDVTCPSCSKTARLYPTLTHDPWYYCQYCDQTGDLLQLLARLWDVSVTEAGDLVGRKLRLSGLVSQHNVVATRYQIVNSLWLKARTRFINDNTIAERRRQLNLGGTYRREQNWLDYGGHLVGAVTASELYQLLDKGTDNGSHRRKLRAKPEQDILVIPHYDAPGHITGLSCVFDKGGSVADVMLSTREHGTDVLGLGFLTTAYNALPNYNLPDTLFVFDDALLALQLHLTSLEFDKQPVPVISMWTQLDEAVRSLLPVSTLIFCGETLSPDLVRAAVINNGRVFVINNKILGGMAARPAAVTLADFQTRSIHWKDAVNQCLVALPKAAADRFITELRLPQHIQLQLSDSGEKTRLHFRALTKIGSPLVGRTVRLGKHTLTITPSGWLVQGGGVVSDCVVIVDKLIHVTDTNQTTYKGRIIRDGVQIEFRESAKAIRHNSRWVDKYLLDRYLSPLVCAGGWGRQLVDLGLLANEPEIITYRKYAGWDRKQKAFVFPNFLIRNDGSVETLACTETMWPALAVPQPGAINRALFEYSLARNRRRPVPRQLYDYFWSLAIYVAGAVIASSRNCKLPPVSLVGDFAEQVAADLLPLLGCRLLDIRLNQKRIARLTTDDRNSWPSLISAMNSTLDLYRLRAQIVTSNFAAARVRGITQDWFTLEYNGPYQRVDPKFAAAVPQLLPNYLQDFTARGRVLSSLAPTLLTKVADDLDYWMKQHGGPVVFNCRKSREWRTHSKLWLYGEAEFNKMTQLAQLLTRLNNDGLLTLHKITNDVRWISKRELNQALQQAAAPLLDVEQVTEQLQQADMLINLATFKNHGPGWLIKARLLEQRHSRHVQASRSL